MSTEKRCTKCGKSYPATVEYFHRDKTKSDGLYSSCVVCRVGKTKAQIRERLARSKAIGYCVDNWYYELHKDEVERERKQFKEREIARKKRERDERNLREPEKYQSQLKHKREKAVERRLRDPQKYIDKTKCYRKAHPEKIRQWSRIWRARRRARMLEAVGSHTTKDVELQFKSQKGRCWWCGKKLEKKYETDHRIPLTKGGTNYANNIVITCTHCNRSKIDKLPHEWSDRLL